MNIGFYLTYEELKHFKGIEIEICGTWILSYLWGIETGEALYTE